MAKVHNNVLLRGISGLVGDQLVLKRDKAGRTILSNKPHFREDRVFTPAQQAQQARFRAARAYAREAKSLEVYQAKAAGTPQTPSNVAMSDWCHAPEIREVDLSSWTGQAGQVIRVRAVDDVLVKKVEVMILGAEGEVSERGEGMREDGEWWLYRTTRTVMGATKVVARAEDLPGHVTERHVACLEGVDDSSLSLESI